ncbi:MAG TPA: hypothetical protein VMV77_10900 [Bacteroidales bacterium]|nr:hypothetical protein [Bacteroidales bacterium]
MKMLIKNFRSGMNVLVTLVISGMFFSGFGIANAQSTKEQQKKLIYSSYFTHQENAFIKNLTDVSEYKNRSWTRGPHGYATQAKNIIEGWEKNNIKGEYATMGVALQQLADEYPEMIEKIKKMKLPVTAYEGVGHTEPCPVGRIKNLAGMTMDEAIRALWEYQTHTLVPNWRFENGKLIIGNPRAGEPITLNELSEYNLPKDEIWLYGGVLATERLLGVIPMDFFQEQFKNLGRNEESTVAPMTAIKRALGMGSYEVSYNTGTPIRVGANADLIASDWPRDCEYFARSAGDVKQKLAHPDDFKIVWPDPKEYQWKPENSALEFFKKTYGVKSFKEMLEIKCPVEYIKSLMTNEEKGRLLTIINRQTENRKILEEEGLDQWETRMLKTEEAGDWQDYLMGLWEERREIPHYFQPSNKTLKSETIIEAASYLMQHWPQSNHDGDFGGPPDYIQTNTINLSLAETFESFAFVLEYYAIKEEIPTQISIKDVLGPIDYPLYKLQVEPKIDVEKVIGINGWQPYELDKKYFPDFDIIAKQGIMGIKNLRRPQNPFSVTANEVSVIQAAVEAARSIRENGYIPGSIEIFLPSQAVQNETIRGNIHEVKMYANSAELLFGMAQLVYKLYRNNFPGPVLMQSFKIIEDQLCRCVVNSSPISYLGGRFQADWLNSGFIWRAWIPVQLLNASWTYKP